MGTRVVMSDLFGRSYSDLDGSVKNRVLDFIVKLQERPDSPGLDLKTPSGVTDHRVKTARVTDSWRAVVIELPGSSGYVLVAVKPHDDAYQFAGRLHFGVNEVTGALEVIDQAALDEAVTRSVAESPTAAEAKAVLSHVRVRDLKRFGVGDDVAQRLVKITEENQLLTVAEALPAIQANAILDLATGRTVDEVWDDLVAEEETHIDTTDVVTALDRPLSRLTFTEGKDIDELRAVLEGDFKAWRVWLHPLQRRLAYHNGWHGPFRVTGGAGTGKTVTAIHRARHLAQRTNADAKILVTTFTRNLAQALQAQLVELGGPDVLNRVDVLNIDSLATRVVQAGRDNGTHLNLRADSDGSIIDAWESARTNADSKWDVEFLQSEWSQVVLAQGIEDRSRYLTASRSGRGRRLSRPQRAELWSIFERFTQLLNAQELMTFTQAASSAAAIAGQLSGAAAADDQRHSAAVSLPQYRHAVVDEAQDLHPAHWRLVRALIPVGDDDLFIVGDAHQRIYGRPVVLSRLGIETRGRSRRLKVNYRTSREILRWSLGVAHGQPADDLEGSDDTLAGARSEFGGPEPEMLGYDSGAKETTALVNQLNGWHDAGIEWSEMAVVARQRPMVVDVHTALSDAGIPAVVVDAKTEEGKLGDDVRAMTMHRAKGLEFRAVAVVGAGAKELPPWAVRKLQGEEGEAAWARERSLLYVCGSRARERLYVSWAGTRSELLPEST